MISFQSANIVDASTKLLHVIQKRYAIDSSGRFREKLVGDSAESDHAFLWPHSALLAAFAQGTFVSPSTYLPLTEKASAVLETYAIHDRVGGYSVLPHQDADPDRYYDDNAWVAWHMAEAFQISGRAAYKSQAESALKYALSGETDDIGGGVWWREKEKHSKNACSNAPTAAACYGWEIVTGDTSYRAAADRIIDWTKAKLMDSDGLIQDNVNLDGKVEKMKWTYNSATFAEALLLRDKLRPSEEDRALADKVLRASIAKWIASDGKLNDPGYFAMHLVDALYLGAKQLHNPSFSESADNVVQYLAASGSDSRGLYAERWTGPPGPNDTLTLHTQTSVLRAFLSARAYRAKQRVLFGL